MRHRIITTRHHTYCDGTTCDCDYIKREYYDNNEDEPVANDIPYKNGKMNGIARLYFYQSDNTIEREIPYVNGIVDGPINEYFESTKTLQSSTFYKRNLKHGLETIFREDGSLFSVTLFQMGKPTAVKENFF